MVLLFKFTYSKNLIMLKTSISFFVIVLSFSLQAQITTTRMNEFNINDPLSKLEKILGKKLNLKADSYNWINYAEVDYKGIPMKLGFVRDTLVEGDVEEYRLYEIRTTSSDIKTLSGVGVGNSLEELWDTYKRDFNISLWFGLDELSGEVDRNNRIFELSGLEDLTVIWFFSKNGIVTEVVLSYYEGC